MTRPGFQYKGGARARLTRRKMVASEAKSLGDALSQTSTAATMSLAVAGGVFKAVYYDADRSASLADTPYKTVMLITPDTEWYFVVEAGTFTEADCGVDADLNSADGIAVDTSTNDDFHIDGYIDANHGWGRFNNTIGRTL